MNESVYTRTKLMPVIRERGGCAVKIAAGPRQPLVLDVMACYRGRMIVLEAKLPGKEKTLTPRQQDAIERWRAAGAEAEMVSYPHEVVSVLDRIDAEADGG